MVALAKDLNELITKYGPAMAGAAERVLQPLHKPGDQLPDLSEVERCRTRRSGVPFAFFPSQREKIAAMLHGLNRYGRAWLIAEMGSGKSPMSLGTAWALFRKKKNFRAIVMCPGHIVRKWRREIEFAIPKVMVRVIRSFGELTDWNEAQARHDGPAFAVISKDTAKLGFDVDKPCAMRRNVLDVDSMTGRRIYTEVAACTRCYEIQYEGVGDERTQLSYAQYIEEGSPIRCHKCGEKLSTNARGFRKNPHIDRYIQRKMKGVFDLMIADEVHELAGSETIQGNTFGTLAAACRYTIALTGTLIGGHAKDLHAPLWRMSADLLRKRGFDLNALRGGKIGPISRNERGFIDHYGVIEKQVVRGIEDDYSGYVKRGACGRKKDYKTTSRPRPGISPDLYNHFLIGRAVFMSLAELGPELPTIERVLVGCKPSEELRLAYQHVDKALEDAIKERAHGGKGPPVLSTIRIQVLDEYIDKPWGWDGVYAPVFDDNGRKCGSELVVRPQNFQPFRMDSKDEKVVEICKQELAQGRRCCIYVQFTGKHDIRPKIVKALTEAGLRPVMLPDNVAPAAREDWINKHLGEMDVLICNPKRVMTGLDLVQFPSLIWYQVGYSTHVLRQASARARRPIQKLPCKVFFLYYERTIQEKALGLMGEKEAASQALEGTFDTRALKAMMNGGANDDIMAALAHSMERRIDIRATWAKVDKAQNAAVQVPDMPVAPEIKVETRLSRRTRKELDAGQGFLFSLTDDMEFEYPLFNIE